MRLGLEVGLRRILCKVWVELVVSRSRLRFILELGLDFVLFKV